MLPACGTVILVQSSNPCAYNVQFARVPYTALCTRSLKRDALHRNEASTNVMVHASVSVNKETKRRAQRLGGYNNVCWEMTNVPMFTKKTVLPNGRSRICKKRILSPHTFNVAISGALAVISTVIKLQLSDLLLCRHKIRLAAFGIRVSRNSRSNVLSWVYRSTTKSTTREAQTCQNSKATTIASRRPRLWSRLATVPSRHPPPTTTRWPSPCPLLTCLQNFMAFNCHKRSHCRCHALHRNYTRGLFEGSHGRSSISPPNQHDI